MEFTCERPTGSCKPCRFYSFDTLEEEFVCSALSEIEQAIQDALSELEQDRKEENTATQIAF